MRLKILVKLNSSKNLIKKINETDWNVWTTKRAIEGEANKSVIDLVAKELGVAKSRITIIKGIKNKSKILEIGL